MDYPLDEELRRRRHPAAKWWLIGDRLDYLGLLPAAMALAAMPALGAAVLLSGEKYLPQFWGTVITFPVAVAVFLLGASLKGYVYRVADREGIKWD